MLIRSSTLPHVCFLYSPNSNSLLQAALELDGTVSKTDAIALASSNLEKLLGLETQHDLVAYEGEDALSLSSRPVAVLSPARAFVELL